MATQTNGIAGAVVVGDVLEGEAGGVSEGGEGWGGHVLASFSAAGRPGRCFDLTPNMLGSRFKSGFLEKSAPRLGTIRHPGVQIEEGAGVDAFLVREPLILPGGGYGPVAPEAYRVTGSILIRSVLEAVAVRGELRIGGHEWPAFAR